MAENFSVTPELFRSLSYDLLDRIKMLEREYSGILCPLRGGFYLSYFFGRHLNLPLYYLEISSYNDKSRGDVRIGIKPEMPPGRYLLCDDIFDSGNTIKTIMNIYSGIDFDTACLVSKHADPPGVFYGVFVEKDTWVDFFWEVM
jgi:hypoxanthine phosphoribosyltransferase